MFYKVHLENEGCGPGLCVIIEMVNRPDGKSKIDVHSTTGKETTFTIF
jgi:hypothetical protein